MKLNDIRATLTALVLPLAKGAKVVKSDVREPIVRPSFKIDVLPWTSGAACDGARERSADIEIWYYPANKDRPRNECDAVAGELLDALGTGFAVGGTWLAPDEDISTDSTDGVLVCEFSLSWLETAAEDGEDMETLNIREERNNASNDA